MKQGLLTKKGATFISLFAALLIGLNALGQNSNVTISTGTTTGSFTGTAPNRTFNPSQDNAILNATDLVNQLTAGNNVTISTSRTGGTQAGNVIFATTITAGTTSGTALTLTVTAAGSITVNNAIDLTPPAIAGANGWQGVNVTLTAGSTGSVKILADISAPGGNCSGNNRTGGNGGAFLITGPAGVTITGDLTNTAGLKTSGAGGGGPGTVGSFTINDGATAVTTGGGANDGQTGGIIDGGAVTKTGTGTFYMAGANTYTGVTTISAGTIKLGANNALGTNAANTVISSGAVLDLNGVNYSTAEALSISGTGISSGGALINSSATGATYAGLLTLANSSSIAGTVGTISLSNTGTISGATFALTLGGNAGGSIASIIGITSGTLTKIDAGTWELSGANTYTGNTTITAGTLRASATVVASTAGAFGNSANAILLNGGTIESNTATFSRAISVTANGSRIDAYGSARTISSGITATGAFSLTVGGTNAASAAGQDLTLSGVLGNGTGTLSLVKNLSSTVILSGTNTYTGSTTITAGTLRATASVASAASGAFGNSATAVALNGGALEFNNATFSRGLSVTANGSRIDAYGAARIISAPISATGTYSLTIGGTTVASSTGQDLTLSGAITNGTTTMAVVKDFNSNLTLSSTSNSYTGGTTISAGTFILGAAGVLADAGAIILDGGILKTGATTGFSETVGTLLLTDNSTLNLGTGNHTLTFNTATSGQTWTSGKQLTINNWVGGYNGTSAGASNPKIFVGANNTGLTSGQLGQTKFFDGSNNIPATILSTGEVVPSTPAPTGLSYNTPNTFTAGTAISNLSPTVTGTVTSYTISPAFTNGLSFNSTTGVISGTPTVAGTGTYNIYASNIGGNSNTFAVSITVNPAGLNNFLVEQAGGGTIGTQTAGTPFNIKITARDLYNNTVTGFNSTVSLSENAANGTISPTTSASFVNGVLASQSVTLTEAVSTIITATNGSAGSSNSFSVNAGALSKLQVLLPGETAAPGSATGKTGSPTAQSRGVAFNVIVNGVDANWNVVSSTNSVTLSASNGNTMPAAASLVAGTKTFSVTMITAGSTTITGSASGLTSNISSSVTINAAPIACITQATGDWNTASTWLGGFVPTAVDPVTIRSNHTATVSADISCASISMGDATTTAGISVNSGITLTVTGGITVASNASAARAATFAGAGTINAASLSIGTTVVPSTTTTTTLASSVSNLNIGGTVAIISSGTTTRNNSTFTITSGAVTVDGTIQPTTGNSSSSVATIVLGNSSPSLELTTAATPFGSTGNAGIFTTTLNGTGATVIYSRSGAQTAQPTTYTNLTVSGSGATTTTGVTVNGVLSMEGTATVSVAPTYGSAATLQYNTATSRTAGAEWITPFAATGGIVIGNTGTITMDAAKVFNSGIPLTINPGATLSTSASNYGLTLAGNFTNSGTLSAGSSTITIANVATNISIDGFTTTGVLSFTKSGGTATLADNVSVGTVSITGTGTLNDGGKTITVTGTGASTWTKSAGTFTGSGIVNFTGTSPQIGATNFTNLQISVGSTATLTGNVNITGTTNALIFTSGTITTGSNILSLAAGTTASGAGAGKHVVGNVAYAVGTGVVSRTFPIGDGTNYAPLTIAFANVTTGGTLTASVTGTDNASIGASGLNVLKSVNHSWSTAISGIAFTTATATFNWAGVGTDADAGSTPANYKVAKLDAGSWTLPTTANPSATSIQVTGVTNLTASSFAIGEIYNSSPGDYYRSRVTGNWNVATNWQSSPDNVNWSTSTLVPDNNAAGILIQSGHTITTTVNATASDLTIAGTLTVNNGINLGMYGDFTNNGIFTAVTGNTVTFAGSTAQILTGSNSTGFYNLVINENTSATTVTSTSKAFTVSNNLTVTQGNLVLQATDANYTVSNDVIVSANGILTHSVSWDVAGKSLNIAGNLSVDGIFAYTVRSHVQMSGSGKTIKTGTNPSSGLCILTLVNSAGTAISANGNLVVNQEFRTNFGGVNGTFNTGTNTIVANGSIMGDGGVINVNGGTLTVTGGILLGTSIANATLNLSSGSISTDAITLGNGTLTGTLNHTGGSLDVGSVTINSTGTLAFTGSQTMTVSGNWTRNGGTVTLGSSNVIFDGSGTQTIGGTSTTQAFNNIEVNKTAGTLSVGSSTTTLNAVDLVLTAGTFAAGTASNINISGDWTNTGGTFTAGSQSVNFTGSLAQTIYGPASTTFYNVTLNNATGLSLSGVNTTISNVLTLSNGKLTTGSNTLIMSALSTTSIAGATATAPGRFIIGNLRKGIPNATSVSQIYQIGEGSNYLPVTLTFTGTTSGSGSITVSTTPANDPNIATSTINETKNAQRYWTITNSGVGGFTSYSPIFTFASGDLVGSPSTSSFIVGRYNSTWSYPTVGAKTTTTTQATGLGTSAFGNFIVGEGGAGVPTMNTQATNQSACSGSTVNFTAVANSVPGSTVQWQINTGSGFSNLTIASPYSVNTTAGATTTSSTLTINPTSAALNNYQYQAIFTNTKGSVTSAARTFTSNPDPTLFTVGGSTSVCSSSGTNITLSGSSTGVNYQLRNDATNANVGSPVAGTNGAINLPTGSLTSSTTFNVLATNASTTCSVEMSGTASVTVNAIPVATSTNSSQTICSGSAFSTMVLGTSNSVAGTTYSWSRNNTATVTGIAASGTGDINGAVLTSSSASPVTVTFTIIPTGPAPTNCAGNSITTTVVINPAPVLSSTPAPAAVCIGASSVLTTNNSAGTVTGTVSGTNSTTVADNGIDPQSVSSSITLGAGRLTSLSNITLTFKASHTFAGDVIATLTSPCGSTTIFSRPGGTTNGDDLINTGNYVFTSTSGNAFPGSSGAVVPNGTYNASFSGINLYPTCANIAGTWTLTLSTPSTGNDRVLTLNSWSISISNASAYTTSVSGPGTIGSVSYSGTNNTTASATVTPPVGSNVYTITTTDGIGCSNSTTATVTVNPLPSASIGVVETSAGTNNDGTICTGAAVTLTANPASGMNYNWANSVAGNTSNASVSPATTTAYTVTVTNAATNCSATATTTITVPMPIATITAAETSGSANNDDNICTGESAVLTANPTSGASYNWAGFTPTSGNGKTVSPANTASYTVTVTHTATGCQLTAGKTITVNSLPVVSVTPNYCVGGGNVQLTSNAFSSYLWSTGETTQSILVDQAGTYTVTATNAAGCTASAFNTVAIELAVNGSFNSGNTGFTTGYTYVSPSANAASAGGNSGLQPEGTYAITTSANSYHTSFFAKDHTNGSGNMLVVNGDKNGNTPIVWQQTVTIQPNTVYYFSAWCMSVNNVGNYAQLQFNVNGVSVGTIANLGAGPTNNSQATANTYWQRFYGTWNSGSSTSAVISIVDLQTAPAGNDFAVDDISCSTLSTVSLGGAVSNNTSPMCVGNDITLQANRVGGMSPFTYNWSGPNSFTSGQENPIITNASAVNTGTYNLTITDAHGCSIVNSNTVTVNARPSVSFTSTPASPLCSQTNAVYATQTGQSNYVWSVPGVLNTDYTIQTGGVGSTNSSVTLQWLTSGSKTVTINYNNAAGCNSTTAAVNTINVNLRPVPTFTSTPATPLCSNTNVTYTTQAGQSAYVWTFTGTNNTDYSIVSGGTSSDNTVTLKWLTSGTKTVTVNYNNASGCNGVSAASNTVSVNLTPVATATNSSQTLCSGTSTSAMVLGTSNSVTGTTFQWSRDNGALSSGNVTGIATSGTATIGGSIPAATLVNTTNAPVTVTFTIIPTGPTPTFCVGNSITTTVVVNPKPIGSATAQSICSGSTSNVALSSTVAGTTFTWAASLLSGNISGASSCASSCGSTISQTLTSTNTGVERYTVTPSANSCSGTAFTVDVTVNRPPVITSPPVGGTVCLGSPINLSVTATGPSLTYQWRKNTSNIASATGSSYSIASATSNDAATYDVVISNACSTVTSTAVVVSTTLPYDSSYYESFESAAGANVLPNCVTTTNLGSKTFVRTYGGIGAHSGTKFGSWGNNADDWFFTAAIYLPAGRPYEFTYWYWSDNTSAFTSMGAAVGTSPAVAAMTTPVGTTVSGAGLGATQVYQQYKGVFTPSVSGIYYFGAHVTTNPGAAADKVVIDDIGLQPTCSGSPTAGTASAAPTLVCSGSTTNLHVSGYTTGYAGIEFQWQSSPMGLNNYTDISGAKDSNYVATVNVSTDYRCKVKCSYSNQSSFTNVVTVIANAISGNPTSASSTPTSVCLGDSSTLTLNGGGGGTGEVIKWYTASCGGTLVGTGNNLKVSPATTTTYYGRYEMGAPCSRNSTCAPATVTVNPIPAATATNSSQTICSMTPFVTIALGTSNNVSGTTFTWTRTNSGTVTGLAASGSGSSITGTALTNTTSSPVTVTFTITPTGPSPTFCVGAPITATVVVSPAPIGSAVTPAMCSGSISNVSLSSNLPNTSYAWVASTFSGTVSGGVDCSSGCGSTIAQTLTSNAGGVERFTITPTSAGCEGLAFNADVTVNALPTLYNVTGGACIPALVGLNGSQTGVEYQLVLNGSINMGSAVSGNGSPISFGSQIDSGVYTVKATNVSTGCTAQMNAVATVSFCTSTWLGVTDTNWMTASNWNPAAVPNNCYVNVIIPNGTLFKPEINQLDINVRNMDISSGVTLSLKGKNLNVCGNWTGGSAGNAAVIGTGIVYINTSVSIHQKIAGSTKFDILQIVNPKGVSLVSPAEVSIATGLHLQTGNFDVSAGTLRFLSASSINNSYVDDFSAGYTGTLRGEIIAERYIPVKGSNQHFISSPVNNPSLSLINASGPDGQYVRPTTDCDETQSGVHSPYGTVFVYKDGYRPSGFCMLGNWMIKSVGNMDNARGYSAYLTGNTTIALNGLANTGNIQVNQLNNSGYPTVNTLQGQPIESGWNLVGNPYPSSLDLTIDRTNDGFQNQVQVWKTSGPFAGTWQADVIDGNTGHLVIPPFQAFMVRVQPASIGLHTYNFFQTERTRATNIPFYRSASVNRLALNVDYNGVKDITKVNFNPSATNSFDDAYDANKTNGAAGRPTLYTYMPNSNVWYSINTLPQLEDATVVPMGLRTEVNGDMTISSEGLETFDPTTYIFLEDKKTGNWQNLRDGSYTFTASKTDAPQRFAVHFTPPANILTTDASCDGPGIISIEQPGSAKWNYALADNAGNSIANGILDQSKPLSLNANTGTYTLTLTDNNGYTVVKTILVGGSQPVVASFTTTAISATAGENIGFTSTTDTASANSYSWNFGDGTGSTNRSAVHSYTNEGIYNASLTVTNQEGCSSTTTQVVTITGKEISTGIVKLPNAGNLPIWSAENRVYVDFTKQGKVEAEIEIYNVLGQIISNEKFGKSTIYSREVLNTETAYMIVKVINDGKVTMKKVFIANTTK